MRVHCLQLGGTDLTSAAGKVLMHVIAAMAEFELSLIRERTAAGLARAAAAGKHPGRKFALPPERRADVRARLTAGATVSDVARELKVSRQTIMRARAENSGSPASSVQ